MADIETKSPRTVLETAEAQVEARIERRIEKWAAVVAALVVLIGFLWGGANFVSNRLALDEAGLKDEKSAREKLESKVETIQADVSKTKTNVEWLVEDRKQQHK